MFAVLYSECPSAKSGGDLGYFGKASMDPAFSAAAFALKPGQISNVVKSEAGYHIIKMEDRMGDKVKCRHILIKPKIKAPIGTINKPKRYEIGSKSELFSKIKNPTKRTK